MLSDCEPGHHASTLVMWCTELEPRPKCNDQDGDYYWFEIGLVIKPTSQTTLLHVAYVTLLR